MAVADSFFDREFERLGAGGDSDVSGVRTNFQRPGEAVQSAATDGQRQFQVRLVGGSNSREAGFGTMVSNCQVGAGGRGLRDCMQRGVGYTVGCRSNNVAGVICGSDPSSPYRGAAGQEQALDQEPAAGREWRPVVRDREHAVQMQRRSP
ncbi:hypothetical protein FJT64_021938 [Amphibalanus amphitrite]|uniref:Uncharacterized protein n=1 Tax=Amphibalanus amphitrite TaxID=1232801 RepID=A0A6A4WWU3_AMPAM|nr:hypothetical protein FJT64_021938 [Amphibalanus amphitrite]